MSLLAGMPAADPAGGTDYDRLPYISLPVSYTQPAHLAAVALVNGVVLPAANSARILELGCASGGNIIPLAARFPDASFHGVDLSARHVDEARARIGALGLRNIDIAQADLNTASFGARTFDYVICHGVFSWVPGTAREAILRLCSRHLSANGAAVISYNVLPGWHLRGAVRDICLRFAGLEGSPAERVRKARDALSDIARASPVATPYGQMLRLEAERAATLPASYIFGEFLAAHNDPLHFDEFVALAARHDLAFLCEATPSAAAVGKSADAPRSRTGDIEQYADYVTGRPFRRSVLIRATGPDRNRTQARREGLHQLHFSLRRRPDNGDRLPANDAAATAWILTQLAANEPASLTLDQLAARAEAGGNLAPAEAVAAIRESLFRLVTSDAVCISTLPSLQSAASAERPRLWHVALAESGSGQPWLTSLAHTAVPLTGALRLLAPHIDGRHSPADLAALLIKALRQGTPRHNAMPGAEDSQTQPDEAAHAAKTVAQTIAFLASNALLAPHGD